MITRSVSRLLPIVAIVGATLLGTSLDAFAQPPCSLTCPINIIQPNDPNLCTAVVTFPPPMTSGTCGTVTCNPPSGFTYPKGTTSVTCTDDPSMASCVFTITVSDVQPPVITCPTDITQSTDPGQCSAVVNYPAPTVTDNCPGVGAPVCSPPSGSVFPQGTTTVTCNVADAAGNPASCVFTITVNDTEPPHITCPPDRDVPADFNGTATVNYPAEQASDNCPGVTSACVPPRGTTFPIGVNLVTCTATDGSGNTASCLLRINVFQAVPLLGAAGLAALVLVIGSIGAWMLFRRRSAPS